MKAKERAEKLIIKVRYAVGLTKALKESKFNSFRDLALHTGFEPAHIQRIAAGKVDVVLTTNISLAEGLGISYSNLSAYYDRVTEKDILEFLNDQEGRKRKSPKKKTATKKNSKRKNKSK